MNKLSWFLYLAEVLPNFGSLAVAVALCLLFFGLPVILPWTAAWLEENSSRPPYGLYALALVITSLLWVFIPSRETIYLIAGSEAGETVVTSEEGKEILEDIQEVIRYQLSRLKEVE